MANTFVNNVEENITTNRVVYTGLAATQATIIGMSIANTSAAAITADVLIGTTYMVKNAPIPVGGALIPIGGDAKVVIETGDTLNVVSTGSTDVIVSALEIT